MKKFTVGKISASLLSIIMILSMFFSTGIFAATEQTESATSNSIDTTIQGEIGVAFRGHIENYGNTPSSVGPNLNYLTGPEELGTRDESLRLEGIAIKLTGAVPEGASITYRVHVQDQGWMTPVSDGAFAGTTSQSLRIEAIEINLEGLSGYDVYYRGHVQDKGDMPSANGQWTWVKNGARLGTTGDSLRLEAIEIKIVKSQINDYAALGDSIAYGMSATPGSGYVNLLYNNLSSISGNENMQLDNLGIPGETSSALLSQLQTDPATIAAVSKAKVITVSIGGNNLLSPLIATVAKAFNLDPTSANFTTELAAALADPNSQATLAAAMPEIQTNLTAGAQQFAADWPQIVGTIRTLAPQAEIYVSTLYDPINSQDPLYQSFDPIIQGINAVIATPGSGYKVADVYTAFQAYQGSEPLVNFSLYTGQLDPHPTTTGHAVIFQSHLNAQIY